VTNPRLDSRDGEPSRARGWKHSDYAVMPMNHRLVVVMGAD
jgi:hypothetical protein